MSGRVAVALGLFLAGLTLALSLGAATARVRLKTRTCIDDGATKLISHGAKCRAAHRITAAATKKSNCPPSPSFRGCYKTVKVGKWRCHGLFPGEGQSFTCRSGKRWIHSSGGG